MLSQQKVRMNIDIGKDMSMKIKQVSAAKHYRSMAEMVRHVIAQYLKTEGM